MLEKEYIHGHEFLPMKKSSRSKSVRALKRWLRFLRGPGGFPGYPKLSNFTLQQMARLQSL